MEEYSENLDSNKSKKKKKQKNQDAPLENIAPVEKPNAPAPQGTMKTAAQKKQEKKLKDKQKRKDFKPQNLQTDDITEEQEPQIIETPKEPENAAQKKPKKRNAFAARIREAVLVKEKEDERIRVEEEARRLKEEEEEKIRFEAAEKARIIAEERQKELKELKKIQLAEKKIKNCKATKDRKRVLEMVQTRGMDAARLTNLPGVNSQVTVSSTEVTNIAVSCPVVEETPEVPNDEDFVVFSGNSDLPPQERIKSRREENKRRRTPNDLRAPVVCVLGHVDTGKTKILDKFRQTNVQDGEAGGITQQIGATNVPMYEIAKKTSMVTNIDCGQYNFPGLLIIDTPGHESFSNLRSRGSSLCDIAILVVDVMHGLEKQTIESIKLLINGKTPFVVALNKMDRLIKWKSEPGGDIRQVMESQPTNVKLDFNSRFQNLVAQFAIQGLNVSLFYENDDMDNCASVVPTSAVTGDGMGNLVTLVCDICQQKLSRRLRYSEEVDATVMEVKTITGMGTTIDVILVNGRLKEGASIVVAGQEGPIVTTIRSILTPPPMKELRIKSNYIHHKSLKGARGVKITGKYLEGAIAGLPLLVVYHEDEVECCSKEVAQCLKLALNNIHLSEHGVYVQASTLGSLEALLEFLRSQNIPYCGINVGPVHKKDVVHASIMLEKCKKYAVILAFDVPVDRGAQELANSQGVQIFVAEIIYHLCDKLTQHIEQEQARVKHLYRSKTIFPCRLKIIPEHIIKTRDPIILGVHVEEGIVCTGTPICLLSGVFLGYIASIESGNTHVENARKGADVSIKIMYNGTDGKKMYGRHFTDADCLVSQLSRESIDTLKEYFRDELTKNDWKLIIELKNNFGIV